MIEEWKRLLDEVKRIQEQIHEINLSILSRFLHYEEVIRLRKQREYLNKEIRPLKSKIYRIEEKHFENLLKKEGLWIKWRYSKKADKPHL